MQNAEGRVQNGLTTEKAITMIDEYLQEPNNISREWVAVLELCRKALEERDKSVILPCKLGDTVWYISTENPHVAFEKELKPRKDPIPVKGILITEDGIYVSTENIEDVKKLCDKVGEDYAYLTKEDAEAEIKRRERE